MSALVSRLRNEHLFGFEVRYEAADEIEHLTKLLRLADHAPGCSCLDKMDSGSPFPRHDWPCSCGLREALLEEK